MHRNASIDALRGFVMFTMLWVNNIAGAGAVVPDWMIHFSDRHSGSGVTFVDFVFPAFLFIVGMSIPFALGARLTRESRVRTVMHVITRTVGLLFVGVIMVNGAPDPLQIGFSADVWLALMFVAAMLAFCSIDPLGASEVGRHKWKMVSTVVRAIGFGMLIVLAVIFVGADGHRIIAFSPFSVNTEWWGILGLIGWAYVIGACAFLVFRGRSAALLGCMALLLLLFPAWQTGLGNSMWLPNNFPMAGEIGVQAAMTVGGVLLASVIAAHESMHERVRFVLLFSAGTALAALFVSGVYGVSKNAATPSWALFACALSAALWLVFYFLSETPALAWLQKPFTLAGQNVILSYLLSGALPSLIALSAIQQAYVQFAEQDVAHALCRALGFAVVVTGITVALNRAGFRVRV